MRCLVSVAALTILVPLFFVAATTAAQSKDSDDTVQGQTFAIPLQPTQDDSADKASAMEQDEAEGDDAKAAEDDGMTSELEATHQEVDMLKPTLDGEAVPLNTFELDDQGNIWACVNAPQKDRGGNTSKAKAESTKGDDSSNGDASEEAATAKGYVMVYGPDQKLIRQIAVPFSPTAIDLDPSNTVYVAGEGKICKMTTTGKILQMASTPNTEGKDVETLKKEALEEYKKQMESQVQNFAKQKERLEKQIAKIEEVEEADRTKLESISQFAAPETLDPAMADYLVASKFRVPSLCATPNHVFVTTAAKSGFAYAIWRVDTNFENPKEVIPQVSGCCGQMDVEADDEHFYVADNTKFCVTVYDLDGEKVDSFGKRVAKNDNGFGSCCNPMNVCCAKNGDLLTAESSIGKIKRFDASGKLVAYVGKARIGAGCKHVALGYDAARDRYYIQYQDKNQICILVPNSEASEAISEIKATRAKLDKAAQPLIGRWIRTEPKGSDKDEKAEDEKAEDDADEAAAAIAVDFQNLTSQIAELEFSKDGTLALKPAQKGGFLASYKNLKWLPEEDTSGELSIGVEHDDVIMFRVKAKLLSDDEVQVSFGFDGQGDTAKSENFHRDESDK
jgi:hypothetical protein